MIWKIVNEDDDEKRYYEELWRNATSLARHFDTIALGSLAIVGALIAGSLVLSDLNSRLMLNVPIAIVGYSMFFAAFGLNIAALLQRRFVAPGFDTPRSDCEHQLCCTDMPARVCFESTADDSKHRRELLILVWSLVAAAVGTLLASISVGSNGSESGSEVSGWAISLVVAIPLAGIVIVAIATVWYRSRQPLPYKRKHYLECGHIRDLEGRGS